MKFDFKFEFRRIMGPKVGRHADLWLDCLTLAQNAWDERRNDPKKVEKKLSDSARANMDRRKKARIRACHDAADEGDTLAEQKMTHGGGRGWREYLLSQGYRRRTAYHRIALAKLRRKSRELFERFASFGLTRLTRLATLPDEQLNRLHPQMLVRLPSGEEKALEYLTDDQLIEFIRRLCPVQPRPRAKVLRSALRAAERAVVTNTYPEPLTRHDAEEARDTAQRLVNRLTEALNTA